jgi:hypothetical protein
MPRMEDKQEILFLIKCSMIRKIKALKMNKIMDSLG